MIDLKSNKVKGHSHVTGYILGMVQYHNFGFGTVPQSNTDISILNRYHTGTNFTPSRRFHVYKVGNYRKCLLKN